MDAATSNLPPTSLSSSFSNIGHDQVQTPAEESKNQLYALFLFLPCSVANKFQRIRKPCLQFHLFTGFGLG
jgi:hypothetical protein